MTERETLLAEIAERQARLAEIDAEPDYEAWRPAHEAYFSTFHNGYRGYIGPLDHWDKARIRGLIAALPKAPPMGECQHEWPSEALEAMREARDKAQWIINFCDKKRKGTDDWFDLTDIALFAGDIVTSIAKIEGQQP
jgi:hypothetical protein